jgi:hypothetical protein
MYARPKKSPVDGRFEKDILPESPVDGRVKKDILPERSHRQAIEVCQLVKKSDERSLWILSLFLVRARHLPNRTPRTPTEAIAKHKCITV